MQEALPSISGTTIQAFKDAGLVGMLLFVLLGLWRRWWYFSWQYVEMRDDLIRDRDFWRQVALQGHDVTKNAVMIAGKIAESK